MKPIPRSALLLLCACAAGAAADDPSTPKLEKPKPAPTSWAALTSKISAAPLLSVRGAPIGMVRYAAKGYEVVRPYMVNPLSLPVGVATACAAMPQFLMPSTTIRRGRRGCSWRCFSSRC